MSSVEIVYHPLIIPSVVIPFTALLAALSALATFIAGLFGLQLKAEGPKKLLEVLLKPRVLFAALVSNFIIIGVVWCFQYYKNLPSFEITIRRKQAELAKAFDANYPNSEIPSNFIEGQAKPGTIKMQWTKKISSGSFRGGVVSGSSVFMGLDDGSLIELDPQNGEIKRSFFIGTPVSPEPVIWNGHIFAGEGQHDTHHARIYKFDLKTGNYVGAYGGGGHIEGSPIVASFEGQEKLFFPSGKDGLHAIDFDLKKSWRVFDGHTDSAVRVHNGIVFSGTGMEKERSSGNKMYALAYKFTDGSLIWKREIPGSSWMRPVVAGNDICYVFGEVYFASDLGGVYCFRQADGTPTLAYNNAAPIVAVPIVLGKDLIISDFNGKICRIDTESGRARWCKETGKAKYAFANPAYDENNGVLVYPTQKNGLFVIDPKDGKELAHWNPEKSDPAWSGTYAPVTILNDGWITVDMKGNIRKLIWETK